jgi:hypothetical protein
VGDVNTTRLVVAGVAAAGLLAGALAGCSSGGPGTQRINAQVAGSFFPDSVSSSGRSGCGRRSSSAA